MQCFLTLLLIPAGVLMMMTLLRWFEQTTEAVDNGWWHKAWVLVAMPFMVWFYPGRVAAGRPTPVPRHEPVRGFGKAPKAKDEPPPAPVPPPNPPPDDGIPLAARAPGPGLSDAGPPPGTPPEFLGLPKVPPKKKPAGVDPEKLAKLRQKMKEQGMLPPGDEKGN